MTSIKKFITNIKFYGFWIYPVFFLVIFCSRTTLLPDTDITTTECLIYTSIAVLINLVIWADHLIPFVLLSFHFQKDSRLILLLV